MSLLVFLPTSKTLILYSLCWQPQGHLCSCLPQQSSLLWFTPFFSFPGGLAQPLPMGILCLDNQPGLLWGQGLRLSPLPQLLISFRHKEQSLSSGLVSFSTDAEGPVCWDAPLGSFPFLLPPNRFLLGNTELSLASFKLPAVCCGPNVAGSLEHEFSHSQYCAPLAAWATPHVQTWEFPHPQGYFCGSVEGPGPHPCHREKKLPVSHCTGSIFLSQDFI